jgi:hypothetical protein
MFQKKKRFMHENKDNSYDDATVIKIAQPIPQNRQVK